MDLQKQVNLIKNLGEDLWKYIWTKLLSKKYIICLVINIFSNVSLHRVIILMDIEVGITDSDKMLIEMLTETTRPFMCVLTKADKIKD